MSGLSPRFAVVFLVLVSGLVVPCSATATEELPENIYLQSTWHSRYEVYLGTLELARGGDSTAYRTQDVFESEIRFDQQAVDQIGAALGDPSFATGIATTSAPDGGSWTTAGARPGWWEKPDGKQIGQPLFDAQGRFATAMSASSLLLPGETVSCSDAGVQETVLQAEPPYDSLPSAVYTEPGRIGPTTVGHGVDRSESFAVPDGDVAFNTIRSFLVLTVHRLKRTCIVSPPTNPPSPTVTPDRCKSSPDTDKDGIADACDEDPSIPDSCALRVARSRVFVYKTKPKARLVVKYKTRSPAQVKTTYTATLANGKKLVLGALKKQFAATGTFKLPVFLDEDAADRVRSARSFTVAFSIPGAPKACAAAYTKQLTKKATVGKQSVWFQSDSVLGGLF